MEKKIRKLCCQVFDVEDFEVIKKFKGGRSNHIFLVKVNDQLLTVRISIPSNKQYVNRQEEARNSKLVKQLNLNKESLYFDLETGDEICKYIEGETLKTAQLDYQKIAKVLKILHNSKLIAENDYDFFNRLEKLQKNTKIIDCEFFQVKKQFLKYKSFLNNFEKTLCHCDSGITNFIVASDGRYYLIDWEFSANNDPYYDIACLADASLDDALKVLTAYLGNVPTVENINRLILWRISQCLQWFLVAEQKDEQGLSEKLNIDFKKISGNYLLTVKQLFKQLK